jgi:hypothetical protein
MSGEKKGGRKYRTEGTVGTPWMIDSKLYFLRLDPAGAFAGRFLGGPLPFGRVHGQTLTKSAGSAPYSD